METRALTGPEFWASDDPVLMGAGFPAPAGIPGLIYFRTSGSTGVPKWIGLSRRALLFSAMAVNRHLGVDAASRWALALPVDHVGGFGVLARVRQAGCGFAHFDRKWDVVLFSRWLADEQPSHLSLVPTQVHDLVAAGLRAPASLRAIVVGGGVLAESTGRAARELGWPVLASYGMTEAGSQVATQGLDCLGRPYTPQPIGVLPGWEVRIEADGRIAIRGEALYSGILTAGWSYEERRGEWHFTSDAGSLGDHGLTVAGRIDTLVKILGELVDPVSVEARLLEHAAGRIDPGQLVVVAVDDKRAGKRLVLVHEESVPSGQLTQVLEAYNVSCQGFLRIGSVMEVAAIPKSPLGKIRRQDLTRMIRGRQN
ncbi:AMP-binding protein [Luteolibacter marinus]|uniref:AMP-binding protein n=1 Tax=Luteolibacter marinus TaxID=2776705 RepID=UPI001865BE64|nr:AMP-binding protein [Luteolibacter marinus]